MRNEAIQRSISHFDWGITVMPLVVAINAFLRDFELSKGISSIFNGISPFAITLGNTPWTVKSFTFALIWLVEKLCLCHPSAIAAFLTTERLF
jgi:hypothetical protein